MFSALYTAGMEWARQDGRVDLLELFERALDVIDAGARLDEVRRPRPS